MEQKKEYISWEEAQKDSKIKKVLAEMQKDYKESGNQQMQAVLEFFQESGGFDRQLLYYLKDHPFTDKERYLKCAPLIKDNADYRWFEIIEEMYRKNQNYMASEVIAAYRDGLSVEEVLEYSQKSENAFQMSVFRKERKEQKGKTENTDIDEVVESVFSLVESVDKEKDEYERNHKELRKELDKNTIMKQDIAKLKKENQKLTDEIRNLNRELGEQRAMLAYYQAGFENAEKDKCALQNELLELQIGAAGQTEQQQAENFLPNEQAEEILELLHEILYTVKPAVSEKGRDVQGKNDQEKAIDSEMFTDYEESDATIQEIQEMFDQMEDFDPEDFMNNPDEYDEYHETALSDEWDEERNQEVYTSDIYEESGEDYEPEEEEFDDLEEYRESEEEEEISESEGEEIQNELSEKSEELLPQDTRDAEKKKRSGVFNNALGSIFKKNNSRQKKEMEAENIKEIIQGMKEKQFDKERMMLITNAMRDGVSQAILLDMVKADMDLDEMKKQLKNIA